MTDHQLGQRPVPTSVPQPASRPLKEAAALRRAPAAAWPRPVRTGPVLRRPSRPAAPPPPQITRL